jgi:hypothetical protein
MTDGINDIVSVDTLGLVDDVTGTEAAADAARDASGAQVASSEEALAATRESKDRAQGFLDPLQGVADRGITSSSFLGDPQAQFDFLQNNPLFQASLDNANRVTQQSAASRGRLNAGDTATDLAGNVLLSAQPLIDRQRTDIAGLLDVSSGLATSRANIETGQVANINDLITGIGNAQASGIVGGANAEQAFNQGLLNAAGSAGGAFAASDERLKKNKKVRGTFKGHTWYSWDWNELAGELLGLFGSSKGAMAQEAIKINPGAVIMAEDGFYRMRYGAL